MASQGPLFPTAALNKPSSGTVNWTNVTNILLDDAAVADAVLGGNVISNYAAGTTFGFTIPAGATINGIQLDVKCLSQGGGGGQAVFNSIRLYKTGFVLTGTDLSTAANLPNGALAYVTFGGAANLWGAAWTPADINDAGFGVAVAVKDSNGVSSTDPQIDAVRVTVTYTPAASNDTLALMGVGS